MPRVGFHDIEVQWRWLSNQNDTATYAILAADGRQIGIYKAHLRVTGGDGVPSWTDETILGVAGGEGMNLTLLGVPRTVRGTPWMADAHAVRALRSQLPLALSAVATSRPTAASSLG